MLKLHLCVTQNFLCSPG